MDAPFPCILAVVLLNVFIDVHLDRNDDVTTLSTDLGHVMDSLLYVPDLQARLPH